MDLNKAIEIAAKAHSGQVDKSGQPYILHPLRVMLRLKDPEARIVGVLHDVIEDTTVTMADIKAAGFSPKILEALDLVTHREDGGTYAEYVERIRDSKNQIAIQVKLADLKDNGDPARMELLDPATRDRLKKKQSEALRILKAGAA